MRPPAGARLKRFFQGNPEARLGTQQMRPFFRVPCVRRKGSGESTATKFSPNIMKPNNLHHQPNMASAKKSRACRFSTWLAIATCAFLSSGCASIVSPSHYNVPFDSNPQGAKLTIKDRAGRLFFDGTTPTTVALKPGAGYFRAANYSISLSKPGYKTEVSRISATINPAYIVGNFFFGGTLGWLIVDPASGAMWRLSTKTVSKTLTPELGTAVPKIQNTALETETNAPLPLYASVPIEGEKKTIPLVTSLTEETFDERIKKGIVIVNFYNKHAPPQDAMMEELARELNGVVVAKLSLDAARSRVKQFNITDVPTFIIFENGRPMTTLVGLRPKKTFIDSVNAIK